MNYSKASQIKLNQSIAQKNHQTPSRPGKTRLLNDGLMVGSRNAIYIHEKNEDYHGRLKVESVQDQKSPAVAD